LSVPDRGQVTIQEVAESVNQDETFVLSALMIVGSRLYSSQVTELQNNVRKWLSPPDPSINHKLQFGVHHKMSATWFTGGPVYKEWKQQGSLLWVHGKRMSPRFLCN